MSTAASPEVTVANAANARRPRHQMRRAAVLAAAVAALIGAISPTVAPAQAQAPDLSSMVGLSSSSNPLDELGRPTPETAASVRAFANQPWVPRDMRDAILSALAFYAGQGDGEGGVDLVENGPGFTQFYWPTVSGKCIGGSADSVGSGIAVPGPSEIPAPGAAEGETVFLFTALGTAPAAERQGQMQVQWFNLNTFQSGITPLHNNGINPEGPTTVSGKARTGKGTVVALLSGSVNTQQASCRFLPTAAIIEVK